MESVDCPLPGWVKEDNVIGRAQLKSSVFVNIQWESNSVAMIWSTSAPFAKKKKKKKKNQIIYSIQFSKAHNM